MSFYRRTAGDRVAQLSGLGVRRCPKATARGLQMRRIRQLFCFPPEKPFLFSFDQQVPRVRFQIFKNLSLPAGPHDRDAIDGL